MQDTAVNDKIQNNFSRIAASLDEISKHLDSLEEKINQTEADEKDQEENKS